jgi:hypothetical protein
LNPSYQESYQLDILPLFLYIHFMLHKIWSNLYQMLPYPPPTFDAKNQPNSRRVDRGEDSQIDPHMAKASNIISTGWNQKLRRRPSLFTMQRIIQLVAREAVSVLKVLYSRNKVQSLRQ